MGRCSVIPVVMFIEGRTEMPKKRKFTHAERYAVWRVHERRCWLCREPLRLIETTIDHVVPESLLNDQKKLIAVLKDYGLPDGFKVNGFENWLPCHSHCNQAKASATFESVPATRIILDRLIRLAAEVQRQSDSIRANAAKDELFARIFVALEQKTITVADFRELFEDLDSPLPSSKEPSEIILLDNGYWVFRRDIAYEGSCRCERESCVDRSTKVHSVFPRILSAWVIAKGLYWKCYDEIVLCPRCSRRHKRGHIGRVNRCDHPYADQERQTD